MWLYLVALGVKQCMNVMSKDASCDRVKVIEVLHACAADLQPLYGNLVGHCGHAALYNMCWMLLSADGLPA